LPWRSFDDKSCEFVSLYRRRFKLAPRRRGRHVFVDFEGVTTASTDVGVTEALPLVPTGDENLELDAGAHAECKMRALVWASCQF